MTQFIRAIYENGVFKPLDVPALSEHEQVQLTVESTSSENDMVPQDGKGDPLLDIRKATGMSDLAENFDDYRFGKRSS